MPSVGRLGWTLAVLAVAAGTTVPAAASPRLGPDVGLGIRLLDVPAEQAADSRARLYITDHLHPGATIHRRVEVSNASPNPLPVTLYPAAAAVADGQFILLPGHTANELSTWTSVTPTRADLPPGGRLRATVTIRVPADAASGERYAVVWAEALAVPTPATAAIRTVDRVGIRSYLSVGSGGEPAADLTIQTLDAGRDAVGHPLVTAQLLNTGGRALDLAGQLWLRHGPGGRTAGPFPTRQHSTIAPGQTAAMHLSLDPAVPAGAWTAYLTVRSGRLERTADARLTVPQTAATASPPLHASAGGRPRTTVLQAARPLAALAVMLVAATLARRFAARRQAGH